MARTFITGDCHGDPISRMKYILQCIETDNSKLDPEYRYTLTRDDIVIITGDFGVIWGTEKNPNWLKEEKNILTILSTFPMTICFADGNHENHDRLAKLPIIEKFGGKVGVVSENVFHLKRGEIYTINGKTFFVMGGAMSTDKHHRTEGFSWWAGEVASKEEMQYAVDNLEKHDFSVDYVIAHTFPTSIVAEIVYHMNRADMDQRKLDPMAVFFERLVTTFELKFKRWFGGHFHYYDLFQDGKYVLIYQNFVEI